MKIEKFRSKLKVLSIVILIFLLAVGCSKKEEVSKKSSSKGYPVKFTDTYNREVTVKKEPKRVISLAPNITETIYSIDGGEKLVGRTEFCDYPSKAKKVDSVGSLTEPNIEKIVELKPDLVIISDHFKKESLEKLEENGITVLALKENQSLEGTYDIIEKVGKAINKEKKSESVVSKMKKDIKSVENKVKGKSSPSVYYVVGYGESGEFTATGETFLSDLIDIAGGNNVAKDAKGWKYSLEKLLEKNPDLLICSDSFETKKGIEKEEGYKNLKAIKEKKLYEIDEDILNRQGPRVTKGVKELAKIIHPEVFK